MQTVWKVYANWKYICSKFDVSEITFWFKNTCDSWRILDVCWKIFANLKIYRYLKKLWK